MATRLQSINVAVSMLGLETAHTFAMTETNKGHQKKAHGGLLIDTSFLERPQTIR